MTQKKSGTAVFVVALILALAVAAGAYFYMKQAKMAEQQQVIEEESKVEAVALDPDKTVVATPPSINVQAALQERVLGNPQAPIKIMEFSSLTCPHCGHFHQTTFPEFKKEYIDTGKAYLVQGDFPLNQPAMHAAIIARCLPADKYFPFIQMLFEEQEKWAYDMSYINFLKLKAGENGLSSEDFDACLQSPEIQQSILDKMKAAQDQWKISSTPSFVVNNKTTIGGALPYDKFKEAVEAAVSGKTAEDGSAP